MTSYFFKGSWILLKKNVWKLNMTANDNVALKMSSSLFYWMIFSQLQTSMTKTTKVEVKLHRKAATGSLNFHQ